MCDPCAAAEIALSETIGMLCLAAAIFVVVSALARNRRYLSEHLFRTTSERIDVDSPSRPKVAIVVEYISRVGRAASSFHDDGSLRLVLNSYQIISVKRLVSDENVN